MHIENTLLPNKIDDTDACTTHYTIPVYTNRLPEDEPSGSKHVEDI
jgi:hypothetical protein